MCGVIGMFVISYSNHYLASSSDFLLVNFALPFITFKEYMKFNICAIITTMSPDENFIANLNAVVNQVSSVIIINDSGTFNDELARICNEFFLNGIDVSVEHNIKNFGIAKSLNIGVELGIARGFKYILTLDDDTRIGENYVETLYLALISDKSVALMIGSFTDGQKCRDADSDLIYKRCVITSGSIFHVDSYIKVSGFDEKMFIDYVDFDFCIKIKYAVGKIVLNNNAHFHHRIGERKSIKLLGFTFSSYNHSPFRIYYQSRNVLYLVIKHFRKEPIYLIYLTRILVMLPLRIIFVDDNKMLKLKNYFLGLYHGISRISVVIKK
jgi:rhamnosyltransferase